MTQTTFVVTEPDGDLKSVDICDDLRQIANSTPLATALLKGIATRTLCTFNLEDSDLNAKMHFRLGDELPNIEGNALAVACALCTPHVVHELLDAGAEVNNLNALRWSGGLFATEWEGPAVFACALADRTDNLRLLTEAKADLSGKQALISGEPRGTLLYEASLSGKTQVVKLLLEHGVIVDETTTHPDDAGLQSTPLHAASRLGLIEIARLLLKASADIRLRSHTNVGRPSSPLALAIDNGQFQIVQMLIEASADLWEVSHNNVTNLEMLLSKGDTVVIASAAAGMQRLSEKELRKVDVNLLVRLLETQGQAGFNVIQAMFLPRKIFLWKRASQVELKSARVKKGVNNQDSINVSAGPDGSVLLDSFLAAKHSKEKLDFNFQQRLSWREQRFMEVLLPQNSNQLEDEQVPIAIFQCVLPGLHLQPRVLHALAHSSCDDMFDLAGCQAIVLLGWLNVRALYVAQQFLHVLQAVMFAWASAALNSHEPAERRWRILGPFMALWMLSTACAASQIIGYLFVGRFHNYFTWTNAVDWFTIGLTLFDIVILDAEWDLLANRDVNQEFRFVLAVSAFFRWFKLLLGWRVNGYVGPSMLPIISAAEEVLPFLCVVIFPLIGITHYYYILRLPDDETGMKDFMLMYRLCFLVDFEMDELGGEENNYTWTAGCIRACVVLGSFGMTVVLMNIFIGVLGESYIKANDTRDRLFVRTRAEVVFSFTMRTIALQKIFGCCCCTRHRKRFSEVSPLIYNDCWEYVWYCKKSKEVPQAMFLDDDAEMTGGQKRLMVEVNRAVASSEHHAQELANLKELIQGLTRSVKRFHDRKMFLTKSGQLDMGAPIIEDFEDWEDTC